MSYLTTRHHISNGFTSSNNNNKDANYFWKNLQKQQACFSNARSRKCRYLCANVQSKKMREKVVLKWSTASWKIYLGEVMRYVHFVTTHLRPKALKLESWQIKLAPKYIQSIIDGTTKTFHCDISICKCQSPVRLNKTKMPSSSSETRHRIQILTVRCEQVGRRNWHRC